MVPELAPKRDQLDRAARAAMALPGAPRVQALTWEGEQLWLKREKERGFILAIRKSSARQLVEHERRVMRVMHARHLPVADIVIEDVGFFVSRDVGKTTDTVLLEHVEKNSAAQYTLLQDIAKSVAKLHHAGATHGGLHLRNICINHKEISFIDMEKAVPENASIADMAYDLRVLIFSVFAVFPGHYDLARTTLETYRQVAPAGVVASAAAWCRSHKWLVPLSAPLKWHEIHLRPQRKYRQYTALPDALALLSPAG